MSSKRYDSPYELIAHIVDTLKICVYTEALLRSQECTTTMPPPSTGRKSVPTVFELDIENAGSAFSSRSTDTCRFDVTPP